MAPQSGQKKRINWGCNQMSSSCWARWLLMVTGPPPPLRVITDNNCEWAEPVSPSHFLLHPVVPVMSPMRTLLQPAIWYNSYSYLFPVTCFSLTANSSTLCFSFSLVLLPRNVPVSFTLPWKTPCNPMLCQTPGFPWQIQPLLVKSVWASGLGTSCAVSPIWPPSGVSCVPWTHGLPSKNLSFHTKKFKDHCLKELWG